MMKEGKQEIRAKKLTWTFPYKQICKLRLGVESRQEKMRGHIQQKNGDVDNILPKNQAILRDLFDACPDAGEVKSVGNKIFG